jgi:hypothetical protein
VEAQTVEIKRHEEAVYEQCDQCSAPLDQTQRYCVVCGTHRRHVRDPAARYLSSATSRSRGGGSRPRSAQRKRGATLGTALVVGVIPLAIGLGVLVGRASTGDDSKLIAALRAQRAQVVTGGSGAAAATTASTETLSSTFPLQKGFAVELQTLPASGTTRASVSSAEAAAKGKGAKDVGLIVQTQYKVTPAPPSGAYVIYAGAFKTQAAATSELSKLKHKFAGAKVIQVQSVAAGAGKVLAKTQYGTAHQVTGFHATQAQVAQGGQIVKKIQSTYNKSYVQSQRGLPDQISVP